MNKDIIYLNNSSSQKADVPDIYEFCKALLFLLKNCYLSYFLKKLGRDALDETNELVEIGKSKICFNFANLLY